MIQPSTLAETFSTVLNQWLAPEVIAEINRRNAASNDPHICASHDFCDANQAMIDALETHGLEWDADYTDLVNQAWAIAKANGFPSTCTVAE